ncbi:YbaB/EbfC family nucleoid-associated protein [Thermodesulfitimonas autotrophica]|uniref:YbaB/EbfC family nucleoid-associated protein n=1 Tax=Thermodesulfitimonas autotrophica TaxID=1894989 RepID=UPI002FE1FA66
MDVNKMMKQVQKLQGQIAKLQEELGAKTAEATAGGGAVRAVVNGRQELVALEIRPEVVDPDDVEMLQDIIVAAVNEALRESREMVAREMGKLTGGLGIPGLF